VSTNEPSRSSRFANARAWTRTSTESWTFAHFSKTAWICASSWTSHGSTNVDPIDAASGRTRFSINDSTDEKPTVAPSSWSARAMPQAIE
jgi:hypothetical protein